MSIKRRIEQFVRVKGRRPRILVSCLGKQRHDHNTKLLASLLPESGFDVDISPLHQTPRDTARMAIENDVHAICFFDTAARCRELVTGLSEELQAGRAADIRILLGGDIAQSEYDILHAAGVDLILHSIPVDRSAISRILKLLES